MYTHVSAHELVSIDIESTHQHVIDVTRHLDEVPVMLPPLRRPEVQIVVAKRWVADIFWDSWQKGRELTICNLPDCMSIRGFVARFEPVGGFGGKFTSANITFRPVGPIFKERPGFLETAMKQSADRMLRDIAKAVKVPYPVLIADHPNCRCATVTVKEKLMKVRNRFYVAAPSVTTSSEQAQDNLEGKVRLSVSPNDRNGKWTRKTLAAAISHAETMLEQDPSKDHIAIVQIVRVVRRKKAPVVVEVVK